MALSKQTIIAKIEILPDGQIQIRKDTIILEDGVELNRIYYRTVLTPGSDVTILDKRVLAITQLLWTPDVIQAYKNQLPQIK